MSHHTARILNTSGQTGTEPATAHSSLIWEVLQSRTHAIVSLPLLYLLHDFANFLHILLFEFA